MATVSGRLLFDGARTANPPAGMAGIANVPVVLQNTATNESLAVLTDTNGNYSFINVPDGAYHIIEAYGTAPAEPTPGNFANAVVTGVPEAAVPPISFAPNPPAGATNLDCVSRNTIPVTVANNQNVINQFILNGPVTYSPIENIMDACVTLSPVNLITDAFNGTMGTFPPGTPTDTSVPEAPFPQNVPDYTYVLTRPDRFVPGAEEYTVQNILTNTNSTRIGAWWRIADHTSGNETGRMMLVNGDTPGSIFFATTVNVTPNTFYLFDAWILNLFKVTGWADPRLGVVILDENGQEIYHQTLGMLIPVNTGNPEWKQIGTAIYSRNNTSLTVEFSSEGPEEIGNDYAIDDIAFQQLDEPVFIPVKSINTGTADVGDTVTYTVTLTNTCQSPLVNVRFLDMLPNGLLFSVNSVTINGAGIMGADPETGFNIPDIPGGGTAIITFNAMVGDVPDPNPTLNAADMFYSYTPVQGGILGNFSVTSNIVPLNVTPAGGNADLEVAKSVFPANVRYGDIVTYTLVVTNNGPDTAVDAVLSDEVPLIIMDPEYSLDGGATFDNPWTGTLNLGNMAPGDTRIIIIRGEVERYAAGLYTNIAKAVSATPDHDLSNNTAAATIDVVSDADIAVAKTASPTTVIPTGVITYTIEITNFGPDPAEDVVLTDIVPGEVLNPEFSIDGGSVFNPWTGSFNIGTLPADETETIIIKGMVDGSAPLSTIRNQAAANSSTPDPDLTNNSAFADVHISPVADIAIEKTAPPMVLHPGDTLTYTLTVTNAGPNLATNVVVTDNIPAETLMNPQFTVDGIPRGAWPGSYNLGTISAMSERTITISCVVSPGAIGTVENIATVLGTTPDPHLENNLSRIDVEVEALADVMITKTAQPRSVNPGDTLTFTLLAANRGPSTAEDVVVTDNLPAGLINPTFTVDDVPMGTWTGSYIIGNMSVNDTVTIAITGTVDPDVNSVLINTAAVNSTTHDPNMANNISSVRVGVRTPRCQAITDVIQSVALQEAALAHILNAEGEKLQAIIATGNATAAQLLEVNASVTRVVSKIAMLESLLLSKAATAEALGVCI